MHFLILKVGRRHYLFTKGLLVVTGLSLPPPVRKLGIRWSSVYHLQLLLIILFHLLSSIILVAIIDNGLTMQNFMFSTLRFIPEKAITITIYAFWLFYAGRSAM